MVVAVQVVAIASEVAVSVSVVTAVSEVIARPGLVGVHVAVSCAIAVGVIVRTGAGISENGPGGESATVASVLRFPVFVNSSVALVDRPSGTLPRSSAVAGANSWNVAPAPAPFSGIERVRSMVS